MTSTFAKNLNEEDIGYLKQVARKTCSRVASISRIDGRSSIRWQRAGSKFGVDLYVGVSKKDRGNNGRQYMCGSTMIHATLDDVVALFHSKAELEQRTTELNPFEEDLVNMKVLHKIRKRTASNPRHSISLKWMRLVSNFQSMGNRDFVVLEVMFLSLSLLK